MGYAIYMIDVYKARVGASATAAVAMLRNLLGGAFPLFTIKSEANCILGRNFEAHSL